MILTVTLNTAVDLTYRVPRLEPHGSHRIREVTERPGGKGLNVARVLASLGHASVITGFTGGPTGDQLRALLSGAPGAAGLTDALVRTDGHTRRTVAVVDESTGDTTQLNEPGPHIAPEEWSAFLAAYRELLPGADAVALCGSLPPGVPVGAYATLVRESRAADIPVLLDTSGEPLLRGLAARPEIVKPNSEELAGITGSSDPVRGAHQARRRGAHAAAVSLGAEGMLTLAPEGSWRAMPPRQLNGNPTGAGDAAVAGLLSGLVERLPWPDRVARAVALSAASVQAPVAGEVDEAAYADLLPQVEVREQAL